MAKRQIIEVSDLGRIAFSEAWEIQAQKMEELKAIKKARSNYDDKQEIRHKLLICEHNPVFTLGKSGSKGNLLISKEELDSSDYSFFKINRGGDITFHGPGQLTVYPILDLDYYYHDVHRYVRALEEVVIQTLAAFDLIGKREKDFTGVWMDSFPLRKICAIGVHMSRWITMHGFALNVNTDLAHFNKIIPCGISASDRSVTSMRSELARAVELTKVKTQIVQEFGKVFDSEMSANSE